MRGERVLVTGGEGFVGGHLCAALLDMGAEVVSFGHEGAPRGYFARERLSERVQVVRGDVGRAHELEALFADGGFGYVFHLAARAIVGDATQASAGALDSNVRGTYLVLDLCRALWDEGRGPLCGVVVASTGRVYGKAPSPHTEDMPLCALGPYEASKVCADVLTRSYAKSFGLPAAVARCVNIYGPGDANLTRIVPGTVPGVLSGHRPRILSDGSPRRDYLYVADAVSGYLQIARRCGEDGVRGEAFNLCTGVSTSVLEVTLAVCAACGQEDLEPEVLGAPGGIEDSDWASYDRARERLGWRPRTDLEQGLLLTARWHRRYDTGGLKSPAGTDAGSPP